MVRLSNRGRRASDSRVKRVLDRFGLSGIDRRSHGFEILPSGKVVTPSGDLHEKITVVNRLGRRKFRNQRDWPAEAERRTSEGKIKIFRTEDGKSVSTTTRRSQSITRRSQSIGRKPYFGTGTGSSYDASNRSHVPRRLETKTRKQINNMAKKDIKTKRKNRKAAKKRGWIPGF